MQLQLTLNNLKIQKLGSSSSIREDVTAECKNLAKQPEIELLDTSDTLPEGAQGEAEIVEWLFQMAQNPSAIKAFWHFVFNINNLIHAQLSNNNSEKNEELAVLKILDKKVALPATTAVIHEFLKNFSND